MARFFLLILFFSLSVQTVFASCAIFNSEGKAAPKTTDALSNLLSASKTCPSDVFLFRQLLKEAGLTIETTMVANEGFHHPENGSFSLFEMVTGESNMTPDRLGRGDFFFGHFTKVGANDKLVADQTPDKNALMIEAFAWDQKTSLFYFYELRGDGKKGQWFYRGNSADIFADNEWLHRQPDQKHPQFGNRLRCSACHGNGGPIMKELSAPHNDWWEPKRKLNLNGREPDAALSDILQNLVPAERLKESVIAGIKKLEQSQPKTTLTLQEQLRPLFCPVELNFKSDRLPHSAREASIAIPVEFFVDSRLLTSTNKAPIAISRSHYEAVLEATESRFPDTRFRDADHAWLTPVKAASDQVAVKALIERGIITKDFALAVLSVDMTNPLFSKDRCQLLRLIPIEASANWQNIFIQKLSQSHHFAAKELLENLTNPARDTKFQQEKAAALLQHCRTKLQDEKAVEKLFLLLVQRRKEIQDSEISKNPLGQILEPGFRIIFPDIKKEVLPRQYQLSLDCEVKEG